jgi:hypothetical protein
MYNHIFGMPIKTQQINTGNTATVSATQLFNQDNKTTAYFPIFISVLSSYICWSSNRIPNQKKSVNFLTSLFQNPQQNYKNRRNINVK